MNPTLKKQLIAFVVSLLLLLPGCIDKVEPPPSTFNSKPVLFSIIKSGKQIRLNVSLAVALQSPKAKIIDNAEVLLYVNNELAESLEHIGEGVYESQLVAQEETEYRCEVTIPGYPTASGSTFIPKYQDITINEHINIVGADEEGRTYDAIRVTFGNNTSKPAYYQIAINILDDDYPTTSLHTFNTNDPVLLNEGLPLLVFSNETIQTSIYCMTINYYNGHYKYVANVGSTRILSPVQVELRTTHSDYYKYIKQLYLYEQSTNEPAFSPGATPHVKLHSNIVNGYGIFTGYSSFNSSIYYP